MTTRKAYAGGAVRTTIASGALNAGVNAFTLTVATGWPSTAGGPFVATIDSGLPTEEKVLIAARSALACTSVTRGYDGTAEVAHGANATIEHSLDAVTLDEANRASSLLTTKGDGIGHDGTQIQREPIGTAGYYLTATPAAGTGRSWTAPPSSLVTAKGQVLAASAAGVLVPTNTPVNGQVLLADSTQAAGVKFAPGGFFPCTSSTRPASPTVGMSIFETDTFRVLVYVSATTGWVPPWNMPWGVMAQNAVSGNSGATSGSTGVLSAPTFTAVANRRYRITISWGGTIQVGFGSSEVQIRNGTATALVTTARNAAAGTVPGGSYVATEVPGGGSVQYNLYTFTNATSVQLQSNYEIIVEDVGPSGNPA